MNLRKLIETVAEFYGIKPSDISSVKRKKDIVRARQVICYLARKKLKKSSPSIGKALGNRDHTTVLYSSKKIKDDLKQNENLRLEIQALWKFLKKQKQYKKQYREYFSEKKKKEEPKKDLLYELNHLSKVKLSSDQAKRQKDMLGKYKNGWTYADVARKYKLSRERVRQIIRKALLYQAKEIINQRETLDLKEFLIKEKKKHIERMKEKYGFIQKEDLIKKEKRWSKDYDYCRKCATTVIKHHSHGYCRKCYPKTDQFKSIQKASRMRNIRKWKSREKKYLEEYYKRPEVIAREKRKWDLKYFSGNREKTIVRDKEKCQFCGLSRTESHKKYGKDLIVVHINNLRDNSLENLLTLCKGCFYGYLRTKKEQLKKDSLKL